MNHPALELVLTFAAGMSTMLILAHALQWGADHKYRLALCAVRVLSYPVRPPDEH